MHQETNGIKVEHGYACAHAARAATTDTLGIRIRETAEIPANYAATVFLNGWKLDYSESDHHVVGLGSTIWNIEEVQRARNRLELQWDAGGLLTDRNGDDPYEWCYTYTLLSWPTDGDLGIKVVHGGPDNRLLFLHTNDSDMPGTALRVIPGEYSGPGRRPRGVLLTGFGFSWTDGDDHHVFQLGFDLGPKLTSAHAIAWSSRSILKDNKPQRSYRAAEIVSVLKGQSVRVWEPSSVIATHVGFSGPTEQSNAFDIEPRSPSACPTQWDGGTHTYKFEVNDVGYDYAIPMLTGWEVGDVCDNNHVKHIGAWLSDFKYEKQPGCPGKLTYTINSTFADKGGPQGSAERFKVKVLGIKKSHRLIDDVLVCARPPRID